MPSTSTSNLLTQDDIDNKNFKGVWETVQSLYNTDENKAQHLEQANHIIYTANLTDKSPVPARTFIALTQEAHRRVEKILDILSDDEDVDIQRSEMNEEDVRKEKTEKYG